jgi:sugar phosphate isomerase/epimerase
MKKNSIFTLFIGALLFLSACSSKLSSGMTLYTVRDDMKKDPKGVLKTVAEIGYKNIEATDYANRKFYGMTPVEFKDYLQSLGLNPLSTHQGGANYDNLDNTIADVKAAGFKYFVIPVPPMGHFKYDAATKTLGMDPDLDFVVKFLNTAGKKCQDAGLQLLYHNHDFEFKKDANGVVPIEYFMAKCDPKLVNFQMDLYWVTKAGADPIAYFEKYPGRFKIWHVKDMDTQGRFAPVGTGTIDFAKILAKKKTSGMKYYIVEQDATFDNLKPLEAIKISYEGLKKFGFQ